MGLKRYYILLKKPLMPSNLKKVAEIRKKKEFKKNFHIRDVRQRTDKKKKVVMLLGDPSTRTREYINWWKKNKSKYTEWIENKPHNTG